MAGEDDHASGNGGLTLAISQLSSSVGDLRREAASGFAELRTALGSKMDKADGAAITTRLDRMEAEQERVQKRNDDRLSDIEKESYAAARERSAIRADSARRWGKKEWVLGLLGTLYIGGMPLLVWALAAKH